DGLTALTQSTVYYPADLYDTVTWHDGSPISVGDFVMRMILQFDRAQENSPFYDSSTVTAYNSFMDGFQGVRILSEDPLIIETYSDRYQLDAETTITTWWPEYDRGMGAWHNLALGLMAEAAELSAFTSTKAETLGVEQLNFIGGPTIPILQNQLDIATSVNYLPYDTTMGQFVGIDEVTQRYRNLAEWHRHRAHFWLGTGPFYFERALDDTVILQRYADYPDSAGKWIDFTTPDIVEVEIDGPVRITIGSEAIYDIYITLNNNNHPTDDIIEVQYLLSDAVGNRPEIGVAHAVENGLWEVILDPDTTAALPEGSNRLDIVVISRHMATPIIDGMIFVSAP
ncbi:MAG: ABC transporter substrate-binding protein, partial [Chloroflexota bacterium]